MSTYYEANYLLILLLEGIISIHYSIGSLQDQYIGCFYDGVSQPGWTTGYRGNGLNIGLCIDACKGFGKTYALLQSGSNCICVDNFNASIYSNSCNVPCSGNSSQYCGGSVSGLEYYAIYSTCVIGHYGINCDQVCHCSRSIPCHLVTGVCPNACESNWTKSNCSVEQTYVGRYIGCYGDSANRSLPFRVSYTDPNPIRGCSEACAKNGSTYAALQYSGECFCGENYSAYGKQSESACNLQCSADSTQICGGGFVNSVYSACTAGKFGPDCLDSCNCYNHAEVCNLRNGTCKSGCKPGWTGTDCNLRVCSDKNGDCSENEACVIVNLNYALVQQCQCSAGYHRDTLWTLCGDTDECQLVPSVCGKMSEVCVNSIGSYTCTCKAGFQRCSPNEACRENGTCVGTTESSAKNNGSMYPIGAVIGAAIGTGIGVAVVCLIGILISSYSKRLRQENRCQHSGDNSNGRCTTEAHQDDSRTEQDTSKYYALDRTRDITDPAAYARINASDVEVRGANANTIFSENAAKYDNDGNLRDSQLYEPVG